MNLVKKFHEEAVEGTPQADAPTSWTAAYQGSSASSGVLGLLEVIQSDFANVKAETSAAEDAAADSFTKFSNDAKQNRGAAIFEDFPPRGGLASLHYLLSNIDYHLIAALC